VFALVANSPLTAQTAPRPSLDVDIRDYAHVPRVAMSRAIAELQAIFDHAGVSVTATLGAPTRSERRAPPPGDPRRPTVTVFVYPRIFDDVVSNDPNLLGVVPGAHDGGRLAYVFAGRIDSVARRNTADSGQLLGIVLAHEIGHVLMPGRPHSPRGVMQPACDAQQIRRVMLGMVGFNAEEAATLKAQMFP